MFKTWVDFVPKGGQIEIGAQTKDDEILFYVKDNGLGIPLDKQKDLFKKFSRLDPFITRRHGGTGLGLSICEGIIKELGGKIWLESESGKGSEFYFTLPKKKKVEAWRCDKDMVRPLLKFRMGENIILIQKFMEISWEFALNWSLPFQ